MEVNETVTLLQVPLKNWITFFKKEKTECYFTLKQHKTSRDENMEGNHYSGTTVNARHLQCGTLQKRLPANHCHK